MPDIQSEKFEWVLKVHIRLCQDSRVLYEMFYSGWGLQV